MEKRASFIFNENLTLLNKIFTEGIPEPLTEEELKKNRNKK